MNTKTYTKEEELKLLNFESRLKADCERLLTKEIVEDWGIILGAWNEEGFCDAKINEGSDTLLLSADTWDFAPLHIHRESERAYQKAVRILEDKYKIDFDLDDGVLDAFIPFDEILRGEHE
ncbi:MAG: hypothetical protein RR808_09875 [Akkermansia sp.]